MRIGMTTFGADAGRSGIGRYVKELMSGMAGHDRVDACDVLLHASEREGLEVPARFRAVEISEKLLRPMPNVLWHQLGLPRLARRQQYDVLFFPAANRRLAAGWAGKAVGTVHDLSILHVAEKYDAVHRIYIERVLPVLLRQLAGVITVSESSRRDVIEFAGVAPDRVVVIPNGWRPAVGPAAEVRQRYGLSNRYLLYVARLEHPGKNHVRLIQAFGELQQAGYRDVQLVLAGPDRERAADIHQAVRESSARASIVLTGYVDDAVLQGLYEGAAALIFPSLYEGFGLPLLEAMGHDVPVACSNLSSLPEVAGQAALFFDPVQPHDMALCMHRLLDDDGLRAHLIEQGRRRCRAFSWEKTVEETLNVLSTVSQQHHALV